MNFLAQHSKQDARDFFIVCSEYVELDIDRALWIISQPGDAGLEPLKTRWYQSIKQKKPDFSVYADPYYFCEVWNCWRDYSRKYLMELSKTTSFDGRIGIKQHLGPVHHVVDLGCGFGYTTGALQQIFPHAAVIGTNLPDTAQFKIAQRYADIAGFKVKESHQSMKTDLVFASEFFEHIPNPVEYLEQQLALLHPRAFLIANTFNSPAIGHFPAYRHKGKWMSGKDMSRLFNQTMRDKGYFLQPTKFWNNRPAYWIQR